MQSPVNVIKWPLLKKRNEKWGIRRWLRLGKRRIGGVGVKLRGKKGNGSKAKRRKGGGGVGAKRRRV